MEIIQLPMQYLSWDEAAAPVLVATTTVIFIISVVTLVQCNHAEMTTNFQGNYSDENGEATKDSEALCRAATPKTIINAAAAAGMSIALYRATTSESHPAGNVLAWAPVCSWALLLLQALVITLESQFENRYAHGGRLACSAGLILPWSLQKVFRRGLTAFESIYTEMCLLFVILMAGLSIPRRPSVIYLGKAVDRQLSVSFLRKISFSWGPFHESRSAVPKVMEMEVIPEIGHLSRVRTLKQAFELRKGTGDLWRQLVRAFWPTLLQQWLLVFVTASSQFGSRFALFKLLQTLETNDHNLVTAWIWVLGLGLGLLLETFSKSWVVWVTQMRLQIPIESMLKTFVLEKTTRKKLGNGNVSSKDTADAESVQTEKLSLTDLLTNDCMETANACAHTHHFLIIAFKLILDVSYLAQLLGMTSVFVGGMASVLLAPLSTVLSKRHRKELLSRSKSHSIVSNLITEALQNLRHIRLSSMERIWQKRLGSARDQELKQMWHASVALALLSLAVNLSPVLLASLALSTYALRTGNLSSSVAFLSLNLFNSLHAEVKELPARLTDARVSWSSYKRLLQYFEQPERNYSAMLSHQLQLKDAEISWDGGPDEAHRSKEFALRKVNLTFPPDTLSVITGNTGSGKSLLIAGILDEADICSGTLLHPGRQLSSDRKSTGAVAGSNALVSQPPWIENTTVLSNILFGNTYDESRYRRVLRACGLDRDLSVLPKGDQTIAGLSGAFLSGGQKWRVALARAFYSSASIVILDDVLSAVDSHVAKQIYEQALTGDLARHRTVILVTHNPQMCLSAAKYHVMVENKSVIAKYLPSGLEDVDNLVKDLKKDDFAIDTSEPTAASELPKMKEGKLDTMSDKDIFSAYIWASGGYRPLITGIFITLIARAAANSGSWWLTRWTSQASLGEMDQSIITNIGIYLVLSLTSVAAAEIRSLLLQKMSLAASRSLFRRLVNSVLYAPLSWVDSMPLGEMIQTLEDDMYSMDNRTTQSIHNLSGNVIHLVFILITSLLSTPQSFVFSAAVVVVYTNVATQQLAISRQLFKLIDQSLRPISEHATSVATGLATIRAFNRTGFYLQHMYDLLDRGAKLGLHLILGQQWLAVRLGTLGAIFVSAVAGALLYQGEDAAKTGLIISLALQLQSALSGSTGSFNIQNMLTRTIGRIVSLAYIETESQDGDEPDSSWPENADVEVRDLVVNYKNSTRAAIDHVSFFVKPRQRVGIVGPTGAGKTSLTNVLLRFITPAEGSVLVGGVDIATIKLERLRQALTLIPQDPFLFSGTLRDNVDPKGMKSDEALLAALRRVHLIASSTAGKLANDRFSDLDMEIESGGKNLSYGQRQLICMARALLIECPVLILDEATSAVDGEVDAAIQQVIRQEFQESTILVVAHRLLTVAAFDSILVLSDGQVAEFGPPSQLMAKQGLFWDMVQKSGNVERIRKAIKEN